MNDSDVFIFVFLVLVVVAFWTEIREFVTFIMGIVFALCILMLTWVVYGVFASLAFCIKMLDRK